jgi:hypothetical protein
LRTNLQTGHLLVGALEDVWIDILLPLLSIPAASSVIEAADTFLSDGWDAYTSPITSQQQLSRILHTSYPGSRYVGGYMPIQPEAMNAWLEQRLANRDPDGRETRWDESINRGIKFIVTNYPRPPGAVSSNGTPEVKKSYPSVNFDEMIERFFQARPLQTLFFILKCGLTQLWDKYYDRFEPHEIQTVEGMIEYRHLLRGAVEGGYNEIANIFLESFREENLEPTPRETIDFFAKYPRLSRLFDVKEFIAVRSFDKKLLERVTKTDEYLAQREEFVAERIRNLPS